MIAALKEVAALHDSPRTSKSHKYEILNLLGAKNTAEFVQCTFGRKW